jgi:hypothetical protein
MTIHIDADVELEDVLNQLDDDDLIDELRNRGYDTTDGEDAHFTSVNAAINYLKMQGCPQNLIAQLAEWALQPVANKEALEGWLKMCGIGGPR